MTKKKNPHRWTNRVLIAFGILQIAIGSFLLGHAVGEHRSLADHQVQFYRDYASCSRLLAQSAGSREDMLTFADQAEANAVRLEAEGK